MPVETVEIEDHATFMRVVEDRMRELRMGRWADLAEHAGLSQAWVSRLKNGPDRAYAVSSLASLSSALGWHHDTLRQLAVGEISPDGIVAVATVDRHLEERLDSLDRRMAAIEDLLTAISRHVQGG